MRNFMLTLSYDGTRYNGWQKQGGTANTIQEKLETVLSRMLAQSIEVAGSGRTDAGVHARRQVCSFKADTHRSCDFMLTELRKYLPEDIGALELEEVPPRFHARLSCREKTYLYRIWNSPAPNVFERRYTYRVDTPLDIALMRQTAAALIGRHDFTAFTSNKHMKKSAVRELRSIEISEDGGEIRILLTGDGFLYNMVRIIAGTLIEAGCGTRSAESAAGALASKDRSQAGFTAPAQGLFLWDVKY